MPNLVRAGSLVVLLLQASGPIVPGTHHELPPRAADGSVADADLLAYARRPFDKKEMMLRTVVLGTHHSNRLVAEFPCSDLCPEYTVRIIRYDLKPGEDCEARGGVLQTFNVPVSIATTQQQFCVPPVLASKPRVGAVD